MRIGDDLDLLPGAGDELPVRVRWVTLVGRIAAVAVDGERLYVAGGALTAFALADGSVVWEAEHPEGYALHDSGGVVLGLDGPQVVRAFAPWEYGLRVERATGRRISYRELVGGVLPADLVALPTPPPTRFRIEAGLRETVAFWPDGQVAWQLVVEGAFIDALPPIEANGAIICATSSCHLVCWILSTQTRIATAQAATDGSSCHSRARRSGHQRYPADNHGHSQRIVELRAHR